MITMNQWVATDSDVPKSKLPEVLLPLHHAGLRELALHGSRPGAGVVLQELPLTGLLCLRVDTGRAGIDDAFRSVLGMALPARLTASTNESRCLRWMAPDEWWLSCEIEAVHALERALREAVSGHLSIVEISGGNTLLRLSGSAAVDVLKKSTGYDVHPESLPPGKVVRTLLGKTGVALRCVAEADYEIIVRRSFADYLWVWLQAASEEHGLRIVA